MRDYPGTSAAFLALARAARQRGLSESAASFLAAAEPRLRQLSPNLFMTVYSAELALVAMSEDDPERGLDITAAHRRGTVLNAPKWVAQQIDHAEIRLLTAIGDLERALRLADRLPDGGSEGLDVRMLVAVERADLIRARQLLAEWPADETPRSRIQQLIWKWILSEAEGDDGSTLDRLLRMASDQGHVQLLLDSGRQGRRLLRARQNVAPTPFLRRLIEVPTPHARGAAVRIPELVERLTNRELVVLRFLPTHLDNAEIAAELGMSVNTLKTHLKHIFRKLDVTTRRAALEGRGAPRVALSRWLPP